MNIPISTLRDTLAHHLSDFINDDDELAEVIDNIVIDLTDDEEDTTTEED